MLNRFKYIAPVLALCAGASVVANANEVIAESTTNSVVLVYCLPPIASEAIPAPTELQVAFVDPAGFPYAEEGQDCAVALAKAEHYGWHTEFTDELNFWQGTLNVVAETGDVTNNNSLAYTLIKR